MIRKRRPLKAGERVKDGRQLITAPGVTSKTDPSPVASPAKPDVGESERPPDEPTEELDLEDSTTIHFAQLLEQAFGGFVPPVL